MTQTEEILSDNENLPSELSFNSCSISCFFIKDVGTSVALETAQRILEKDAGFSNVIRYQYDPSFFNPVFTMTPLSFSPSDDFRIREIEIPLGIDEYYRNRLSKLNLLLGCTFRERFFLYTNGILAYQIIIEIEKLHTTDDLIFLSNCFIKHNPTVKLQSSRIDRDIRTIRPLKYLGEVQNLLTSKCNSQPRTDTIETYSLLIIHELSSTLEQIIAQKPFLRLKLYDTYENEFHALCVRTIEDWEKRFPKGAKFSETNSSLSPVGVLRVNIRNILVYEYPYSKTAIEKLFYPAIIELRAWSFILAIFIAEIQLFMDQIDNSRMILPPRIQIETKRKAILNALDDFNGYTMATSRRTKNFYEVAMELFEIDKITNLLLNKLAILQDVTAQEKFNEEIKRRTQIEKRQIQLLDGIQDVLKSQQSSSAAINIVSILLGGALAFNIAEIFKINPNIAIISFFVLVLTFFAISKRFELSRFVEKTIIEFELQIGGKFELQFLMEAIDKHNNVAGWKIDYLKSEDGVLIWQQKKKYRSRFPKFLYGRKRIDIVTISIFSNTSLDLNSDIFVEFNSNFKYDQIIQLNPEEMIKDIVSDAIHNLSLYVRERGESPFFTASKGSEGEIFSKRNILRSIVKSIARK